MLLLSVGTLPTLFGQSSKKIKFPNHSCNNYSFVSEIDLHIYIIIAFFGVIYHCVAIAPSPYLYPRVLVIEDFVFLENSTASIIKINANLKENRIHEITSSQTV